MPSVALDIKNLSLNFGSKKALNNVSFNIPKKEWCMLLGPNGAGKSTLVYALAKNIPYSGSIKLFDKDIQDYKNTQYAQKIGFLSQKNLVAFEFSVEEIVAMGRYSHISGYFSSLSKEDKIKIDEAIETAGLQELRHRSVQELSGGEVQRTFLAQVLAQDPEVMVLDEPTNNLDLVYQEQIFELLGEWISKKQGTVLSVVHDIALAKHYGTSAALLDKGNLAAFGKTNDVLTYKNLNKVYGMDVEKYFDKLYKSL